MARPYRYERDLDKRYDVATEEAYRIEEMENNLKHAISTAEDLEQTHSAFDGVPDLLRGVLSDIADERAQLEQMCDEMWHEMRLRGDVQ